MCQQNNCLGHKLSQHMMLAKSDYDKVDVNNSGLSYIFDT